MKKSITPFSLTVLFFLCLHTILPIYCLAETSHETSLTTVKKLRNHLSSLSNLSFHFTQRTMGQMSGRPRQASGKALFVQNGDSARMRWDYSTPDTQVIISDGKTLKMYFAKMKQMIIAPASSLQQDVTYSFFAGSGNLENDFLVSPGLEEATPDAPTQNYGFEVIKLVPKAPTTQVKYIRLWVNELSQIKRLEIHDNFDTITLLSLSNIEENISFKDGLDINMFDFTPPEGTEIIRQ